MNDFSNLSVLDHCLVPLMAKESTALTILLSSIVLFSSNVEAAVTAKVKKEQMIVMTSDLVRRMSSANTVITLMDKRYVNAPKSTLGKRLSAIRERAFAQGLQLLTEDEIRNEVMRRRGEVL